MRRAEWTHTSRQTNSSLTDQSAGLMTGYTGYLCRSHSTPRRAWAALNKVLFALPEHVSNPGDGGATTAGSWKPQQPSTGGDWGQMGNEELLVNTRDLQPNLLRAQQRLRGRTRVQVWGWHLWALPWPVPPLLQRQSSASPLLGKHWTPVICQTQKTSTISMLTHES